MKSDRDTHQELRLFFALAAAGVVAALFHVHIPHTEVLIDGRWAFGFMGFVLLRRRWAALALAALLSYPYGTPDIPLWVGFAGNMLYAVPCLLIIRPLSGSMVRRFGPGWLFGLGWVALILACYQAFITPAVWAVIALLENQSVATGLMDGWRTQPFLVESILVALFSAAATTAALAVEQLRAERERLEHINSVLRGIRNVNQLIVTEDDPKRLIERACVNLTETMGYLNAWIALLGGETGQALGLLGQSAVAATASAGFDGGFETLREQLERGEFPACMKRTLDTDDTVVSKDPSSDCPDCPLSGEYGNRAALASRLTVDGVTYGILTASTPVGYAHDEEEQDLLNEVAGDLAFALHKITMAQRLEKSRHHLELVVKGSGIGTWEWNVQTNETIFNEQWAAMLGYTIKELSPYDYATWERLVHPDDLSIARDALMDCIKGRTPQYDSESRMKHKDGHWVWILDRGRVMTRDAEGKALSMFGTHTDITEIKRAEEALRESLERLEFALQGGALGMWDWYPQDDTVLYSDLWAQILGYRPNEVEPTLEFFKQHVHPEDLAAVLDRLAGHVEGRLPAYESEHRLRAKSGGFVWVMDRGRIVERDKDGSPVRVSGIIADITERKRAEEAIARQQRSIKLSNRIANVFLTSSRNELFADVLDVIRMALDSRFGYFGYIDEAGDLVSPSLTRDVWDQCQVAEKSVVFPRASWRGLWGRSLTEKQTLISNENLQIPQGHVALENALATPIVYNDNLIGQFVVANKAGGYSKEDQELLESAAAQTAPILFAIQEEARHRTAHERLEAQMRQAQKMEAVGRLAGGVAHDFNNMLGVILGHAELALDDLAAESPLRDNLAEIRQAAERSANLTRQLLAFARKQTVAPRVLDLNETVASMLNMLERLIGEDIDLAWRPGKELWPVKMDPVQIDQILANLCVNARDAIADVGKVTIETDNIVFDEDYCGVHAGFVPGEYALLAVSDNGCGMDFETQSHLFEPFFTTKELGKGTGLGLATVYGVVKQNDGFINVYSELGQGTTFRIYLPRHRATGALLPDNRAIRPPVARGHETILLLEDEPAILRMTTMMLERQGYAVLEASSPSEAIRLANEHAGEIHLLMTDVVMPEMNGRDLAKSISALYPSLKCLFMSGYTANVIAHHGVLEEGVNFIQKPFSLGDLSVKVREALES